LPQAMKIVVGDRSGWLHMLVWIGLFGLIASFHGIIMGYSRQIFALSRAGFLPQSLSRLHPRFKTPHRAILGGGVIGMAAIYSDELLSVAGHPLTANIVTMSVFGAIVLYIVSMVSLFRLRRSEPGLDRPFRAPFYPFFPAVALCLASVSLAAMIYYNPVIFAVFVALFGAAWLFYSRTAELRDGVATDDLLSAAPSD